MNIMLIWGCIDVASLVALGLMCALAPTYTDEEMPRGDGN